MQRAPEDELGGSLVLVTERALKPRLAASRTHTRLCVFASLLETWQWDWVLAFGVGDEWGF